MEEMSEIAVSGDCIIF